MKGLSRKEKRERELMDSVVIVGVGEGGRGYIEGINGDRKNEMK